MVLVYLNQNAYRGHSTSIENIPAAESTKYVNKFADTVVQDTLSRRFRNTTTRYAGFGEALATRSQYNARPNYKVKFQGFIS